MRNVLTFENFTNDDNRSDTQSYPKFNQASRLQAKEYVENIFNQGLGADVYELCKEIGCEIPNEDDELDTIKEKAVEYFIKNPERIKDKSAGFKTYQHNSGDGVARTNNIGGVMNNESIDINSEDSTKISLTDVEMKLFSTEGSLMNLIRNNKISLHNKEVWFSSDDLQTKKVLNAFFDVDNNVESLNESKEQDFLKWLSEIKKDINEDAAGTSSALLIGKKEVVNKIYRKAIQMLK